MQCSIRRQNNEGELYHQASINLKGWGGVLTIPPQTEGSVYIDYFNFCVCRQKWIVVHRLQNAVRSTLDTRSILYKLTAECRIWNPLSQHQGSWTRDQKISSNIDKGWKVSVTRYFSFIFNDHHCLVGIIVYICMHILSLFCVKDDVHDIRYILMHSKVLEYLFLGFLRCKLW